MTPPVITISRSTERTRRNETAITDKPKSSELRKEFNVKSDLKQITEKRKGNSTENEVTSAGNPQVEATGDEIQLEEDVTKPCDNRTNETHMSIDEDQDENKTKEVSQTISDISRDFKAEYTNCAVEKQKQRGRVRC
jgi:hypothetical protein